MLKLPTKQKLFALSVLSTMFLSACLPKPVEVAAPPKPNTEALRSLCAAWLKAQNRATWVDTDAEETKDGIDYGYRAQEAACAPYQQGNAQ